MAYYRYDFENDALASEPSGFTKRWAAASASVDVVENSNAPSGKAVRVLRSSAARVLISADGPSSDPDRNVLRQRALIQITSNLGDYASALAGMHWLVARASGTSSETGYAPGLLRTNRNWRWLHYSNGSPTQNSQGSSIWTEGNRYWLVFDVNGNEQSLSLFNESDYALANPLSTISRSDSSITQDGWVGFGGFEGITGTEGEQWLMYEAATGATPLPALIPEGVPVITGVTPGSSTADVTYTTDNVWAGTSYEYRVDGGAWQSIGASPATITGLTASTVYNTPGLELRAINSAGDGESSTPTEFTTTQAGPTVLRNSLPLYDTPTGPLTNISDVAVTILTVGATPSVVYHDALGVIVDGYVQITDAAFETINEEFEMVLRIGTRTRSVTATVVES